MVFPTRSVDNYISIENSNEDAIPDISVLFWINTLETQRMIVLNYFKNTDQQLRIFVMPNQVEVKIKTNSEGGGIL
jgi:lipid-A-disaccharide synthase-like uncharacterized protein